MTLVCNPSLHLHNCMKNVAGHVKMHTQTSGRNIQSIHAKEAVTVTIQAHKSTVHQSLGLGSQKQMWVLNRIPGRSMFEAMLSWVHWDCMRKCSRRWVWDSMGYKSVQRKFWLYWDWALQLPVMDTLILFDFDWSLIDCNSDTWVVDKLGASDLMRSLRHILPWTQLMVSFLPLPLFPVHVCLLFLLLVGYLRSDGTKTWARIDLFARSCLSWVAAALVSPFFQFWCDMGNCGCRRR